MAAPTPIRPPVSAVDSYVASVLAAAPEPTAGQKAAVSALIGPALAKVTAKVRLPKRRSLRRAA